MKELKILLLFLFAYAGAYAQKAQKIPTWYEYDYNQFSKGLAIPSGNWQIPAEYQSRVHLRGSTTDSLLEVFVPTLGRWAKVGGSGGGFSFSDTTVNGTFPLIPSGWWVQQKLNNTTSGFKYYTVDGDTLGIDFTNAAGSTLFRMLFGSTWQPKYLTKVLAGTGLTKINDSTLAVDALWVDGRAGITLTTSGIGGAASWDATTRTLNIPSYTTSSGGTGVSSIVLNTGNTIHNTPVSFTKDSSNNWVGTLSLKNQPANKVLASPIGESGAPTFRSLIAESDISTASRFHIDPTKYTLRHRGNSNDTLLSITAEDSLRLALTTSGGLTGKFYVSGVLQNHYRFGNSGNQVALQYYNKAFESRSEIKYLGDAGGYEFRTITGPGTPITRFAIFGSGESVFYNTTTVPKLRFSGVTSNSNVGAGDIVYNTTATKFFGGVGPDTHQFITADASNNTTLPGAATVSGDLSVTGVMGSIGAATSANRSIDIGSNADNGVVAANLGVYDATGATSGNYRRASLFLNDANGVYGLNATASSGPPDFVIQNSGTELLRLKWTGSAGNLGIGINNPLEKLDVQGNAALRYTTSGLSNNFLRLGTYDNNQWGSYVASETNYGTTTGTSLLLGVTDITGTRQERMRILPAGSVGIGTTTPFSKLTVVGGVKADSLIGNNFTAGHVVIVGTNKELKNGGTLATVATTGSYADLSNKPTIPAAQVNSDWNATSGAAQILNKPTIPTATSQLTNDASFTTLAAVNGTNKVVPDANYTILSTDKTVILPNPSAQRTLTLPAASSMQNKEITIINWGDATSDWVLSGSYIQRTTTGGFTSSKSEDFVGSGLFVGNITLRSVNMTGSTWKWVQTQ